MQQLSRYLVMEGKMGECPDDYALFQAAKYCNCKPWELMEVSKWWQFRAIQFIGAENKAREILKDRNNS